MSLVTSVLVLTTPFRPNIGGVETHLDDLLKAGPKNKIRFTVITYQPLVTRASGLTVERTLGSTIYRIPWFRLNLFLTLEKYPALEFMYLFPPLFIVSFFYLIFKISDVQVIHAQGLVAGVVGVILGKIFSKKTIISTHSIYNFPKDSSYSSFTRWILRSSNKVLTLSKQSKQEIVSLGVPESKVSVFTYWVDQSIFKPLDQAEVRHQLNLPADKYICLFVGRLVEGKGVQELISSAEILKRNRKILFVIAGDGPLSDIVSKYSDQNQNLIYLGKIANSDLPSYYNIADVFIIPSTHEEGFGRVILEALSCGTPVIGSRRGAIPEAINDNVGVLIDVTPKNIADCLVKTFNNRSLLSRLSKTARKYAVKNFSEKNAKMIFKYYE